MFKHRSDLPVSRGLDFSDSPSLCERQFQRDCDINYMIRRYLSGDVSVMRSGNFLDVSEAPESYHDIINITARGMSTWEGFNNLCFHN